MKVTTILFDLGGTLIDYRGPARDWPSMERLGFMAVYNLLGSEWAAPAVEAFHDHCFANLESAWYAAVRGERNLVLEHLLQESLAQQGISADRAILERAVEGYTSAISRGARLRVGARELLERLSREDRRLGLISNTMWPPQAHIADLERFGLLPYLDELIFTAERGIWKPDPRIFALALETLGGRTETAVFVGDNPHDDVIGARNAGMRSIWLRTREYPPEAGAHADAIVDSLLEIREVLAQWEAAG